MLAPGQATARTASAVEASAPTDGSAGHSPSLGKMLSYGALGLPLAFAALPIYVHLPRLYGETLAVPLAMLGAILLMTRLADAVVDPLLGHFSDRWQRSRPLHGRSQLILLSLPVFIAGLWLLLSPPPGAGALWLSWTLCLTYLGFSLVTITYQAWGADLAHNDVQRRQLTASREAFGLIGVMLAATLPSLLSPTLPEGLSRLATLFVPLIIICALISVIGCRALPQRPLRAESVANSVNAVKSLRQGLLLGWHDPALRRLLLVFLVSGTAAALPATLVMFFIADVIQAEAQSGLFLATYFASGLFALPLWLRWASRRGTLTAWRDGMLVACLAFAAAPWLGAGDSALFLLVCVLSGLALGADLALPAAHLAALAQRQTATYFGLWNFVSKFNLALAAGIALPLLALAGYQPGGAAPDNNTAALSLLYGGLPLLGKLLAAALLMRWQAGMVPSATAFSTGRT